MPADATIQGGLFIESAHPLEVILLNGGQLRWAEQFYSASEAAALLNQLLIETPWQQDFITVFGKRVAQPRLSAWFGDPEAHYSYSGIQLQPRPWSPLLAEIRYRMEQASGQRFNSVLLNYYRDGRDGMGWHSDDEPSLGTNPVIASLSLGATRRFRLRHRFLAHEKTREIALSSGSVLIMEGATQHAWQHCVPKESAITGARINLTFRQILDIDKK